MSCFIIFGWKMNFLPSGELTLAFSNSCLLSIWGTAPVWKDPGKRRGESFPFVHWFPAAWGALMSTAVCCSHSPFTCGKAETQRSRVCASCTFKATNEKKQNESLLTPGMNSVELLAKALFSRNTPQIYPFRPGIGFAPYKSLQAAFLITTLPLFSLHS